MGYGDNRREIIVVSFGSSNPYDRQKNIVAVEDAVAEAYNDWIVDRAYTNFSVIDEIKANEGLVIDTVEDAIQKANNRGVSALIIQPTLFAVGPEYRKIVDMVDKNAHAFRFIEISDPLLSDEKDYYDLVDIFVERTDFFDDGESAIIMMAQGVPGRSNAIYEKIQAVVDEKKFVNYYVSTLLSKEKGIKDIADRIQGKGYKRVVLAPLMMTEMDNVNEKDKEAFRKSWSDAFKGLGYEVEYITRGLGSMDEVQNMYIAHLSRAMQQL